MLKKWNKFLVLLTSILVPSVGFAQVENYTPEPAVLPVHTLANQLHLSAGYAGNRGGYGLTSSYALNSSWAVFASGYLNTISSRSFDILGPGSRTVRKNYNIGAGLGFLLPRKNPENVAEVYLGVGKFYVDNAKFAPSSDDDYNTTQADYWKLFIQLNYIKVKEKVEFGGLLRVPYNRYTNYEFAEVWNTNVRIDRGFENVKGVNLEPVASFSLKKNNVKLNLQAGYSLPIIKSQERPYFIEETNRQKVFYPGNDYKTKMSGFIGSINLQYNLNRKSG
ncbi:hypothetical protein [Rufibacter latericius]|uniref:Outer membrane protein beta-barrel domain-containing protein n=1 Tax=Rufibacter latericius TaxID=2487040 RepID=A0A3M9ME70_9BACT|nr:hypothetical protein [Rufibacter latericius]RNI23437.1 hypothetical protein EFB08_18015 [Rufibacter latericius]